LRITLISFLLIFTTNIWAIDLKETTLVNGCQLINWSGEKFKVFPGSFCQFFDDGSFLTATRESLKYLSKNSEVLWEFKANIHHQVNMSHDLQRILIMSSDFSNKDGASYRIDRLVVLSREGKVLMSESAADYMNQAGQAGYSKSEMTHFNSFYEIPEVKGKVPEYIKKGNYIANSNTVGTFILSADLKKVLHFRKIHTSYNHQIHDVQILPNGRMIYFNNSHNFSSQKVYFSTIEEMDLDNSEIEFEFRADPEATFFSRHCGGVQKFDEDTLVFSHMLTGTYVYSKKKKAITHYSYQTHLHEFGRFSPSQQVKALDLRSFLAHWK
jgi:hypothetical protein